MFRSDSIDLSVIIPYYDDFAEALLLGKLVKNTLPTDITCELVLVQIDPALAAPTSIEPDSGIKILRCPQYSGLPFAKNLGFDGSSGEYVLFLFPGSRPEEGAVEHLVRRLQNHPEWGAVSGRWNNEHGDVEKGYNIRQFPTFLALVFDVLLVNKLFPGNGITRHYKMHDFDHNSLIEAKHANDCIFLSRRSLLMDLGKFDENYHFAWFDQIEMCAALSEAGRPVYFDPDAIFTTVSEPLADRILAPHYRDYYADLTKYVATHYSPWRLRVFTFAVFLGMAVRLSFSRLLPRAARKWLLRRYRSFVSDEYIQSMTGSYGQLLKHGRLE